MGYKPTTSGLQGMCSTAVLQPQPLVLATDIVLSHSFFQTDREEDSVDVIQRLLLQTFGQDVVSFCRTVQPGGDLKTMGLKAA